MGIIECKSVLQYFLECFKGSEVFDTEQTLLFVNVLLGIKVLMRRPTSTNFHTFWSCSNLRALSEAKVRRLLGFGDQPYVLCPHVFWRGEGKI